MGHQVNFFILPGDLPAIEQAIQATGDICFLADHTASAEPEQLAGLEDSSKIHSGHRRQIYLARRDDLGAVSTRYVDAQGYWLIESTRSPVIEFTTGVFDNTTLDRSRAYFASDLRFRKELPSPDFVRWGDRVLRGIKRRLTRNPDVAPGWIYLSTAALHWVQELNASLDGGAYRYRAQDAVRDPIASGHTRATSHGLPRALGAADGDPDATASTASHQARDGPSITDLPSWS